MVLDEPTVAMDVEARRAFWATMRRFAARGTTVVFATHYLEEADEFADRIVLMAHGRIVADGPSTEIKAHVGMRTIRATLPGVSPAALAALPGVAAAERHGDAVTLAAPTPTWPSAPSCARTRRPATSRSRAPSFAPYSHWPGSASNGARRLSWLSRSMCLRTWRAIRSASSSTALDIDEAFTRA